ncbi:hypothetical protein [Clostridioides difficile]|uniref:hypothetical protein n=1 Tax=Clostridioides difficile TaxID=1496 RepID=UPI003AA98ED4
MWYVKVHKLFVKLAIFYNFILTMWYVKIPVAIPTLAILADFILTMWRKTE